MFGERRPKWQDNFLAAYVKLGKKASISEAQKSLRNTKRGVSIVDIGFIYACLSESDPDYDKQFHSRFLNAETVRLAPIEDKLQEQMVAGEIPGISLKYLQMHKRTRDRYRPPAQEMKIETHSHLIEERRATLRLEMVEQSHTMFGKEVKDVSQIKRPPEQIKRSSDDLGRAESLRSEGEEAEEGEKVGGKEKVAV